MQIISLNIKIPHHLPLKKEATDAIPTVIARYGYALEYSYLSKQVVAVASD